MLQMALNFIILLSFFTLLSFNQNNSVQLFRVAQRRETETVRDLLRSHPLQIFSQNTRLSGLGTTVTIGYQPHA